MNTERTPMTMNMKGTNILTKVMIILMQKMLMRAIRTMLTIMKVMVMVMCMEKVLHSPNNRLKQQA